MQYTEKTSKTTRVYKSIKWAYKLDITNDRTVMAMMLRTLRRKGLKLPIKNPKEIGTIR